MGPWIEVQEGPRGRVRPWTIAVADDGAVVNATPERLRIAFARRSQ
jgi:hypothetical protein